jgi:hypothetical protein
MGLGPHLIRIHAQPATARVATGRTPEARADLREAERILGQVAVPGQDTLVRLAGGYARVSAAVGVDEGRAYADRAMALLRRVVAAGGLGADDLQSDPDFVPLRARADFQELLMGLSFPADPFAGGDSMAGPASPVPSLPAR